MIFNGSESILRQLCLFCGMCFNFVKYFLGSEIYERLPDSGSQADDLNERVGSDEFIGSRIAGGHDSDMYSSLDRAGENGDASMGTGSTERLVRPSQMKKNKQGKLAYFMLILVLSLSHFTNIN